MQSVGRRSILLDKGNLNSNVDVKIIVETGMAMTIFARPEGSLYAAQADLTFFDDATLYFNRLVVPRQLRNQGLSKRILTELASLADEKGYRILLEINPYGDLDYGQLRKLYESFGFIQTAEGYWVRDHSK